MFRGIPRGTRVKRILLTVVSPRMCSKGPADLQGGSLVLSGCRWRGTERILPSSVAGMGRPVTSHRWYQQRRRTCAGVAQDRYSGLAISVPGRHRSPCALSQQSRLRLLEDNIGKVSGKEETMEAVGWERIIPPLAQSWWSWFFSGPKNICFCRWAIDVSRQRCMHYYYLFVVTYIRTHVLAIMHTINTKYY